MQLGRIFVALLFVISLVGVMGCGCTETKEDGPESETGILAATAHTVVPGEVGRTGSDLICGMEVTVSEATAAVDYGGETYYFCSMHCMDAFVANPGAHENSGGEASHNHKDGM